MKQLLLLFALVPTLSFGQVEKKVLQMDVVRVAGGTAKVQLDDADDYLGPILNQSTNKLVLPTTSINRSRIKEIRFEIVTVTVDTTQTAIQVVEADDVMNGTTTPARIFDLQGRQTAVPFEQLPAGIYVRNGKKILKK